MASDDRPEEDLREATDAPTGGRQDLREADRRGKLAEPSDVTTPGAIADKIRALRKELAERRARKGSERLQNARDKQARRKPLREAKQEALKAADENSTVKKATSVASKAAGVASKAVGAASSAGASGGPGTREAPGARDERDTDPVVRAGETAKAGAPMDATLDPFGGPANPAGPRQLMLMAGGGTPRERAQRRRERGVADIQTFATMGLDVDPIGGAGADVDDQDTIYAGNPLDVDSEPLVDDDNGGML